MRTKLMLKEFEEYFPVLSLYCQQSLVCLRNTKKKILNVFGVKRNIIEKKKKRGGAYAFHLGPLLTLVGLLLLQVTLPKDSLHVAGLKKKQCWAISIVLCSDVPTGGENKVGVSPHEYE